MRSRSPKEIAEITIVAMDRYWLLTNTCYGQWLPGDERGFLGRVWEHRRGDPEKKRRVPHAIPGTDYDENIPKLSHASAELMSGPPIALTLEHAEVLLAQFQETARLRHWELRAVAIMFNHFHLVVGVPGDPNPGKILGDFKSWATRRLNQRFGKPKSETWWTERGSKRKLKDEEAILGAENYVLRKQPNPLVVWSPGMGTVASGKDTSG
jgi:REP element-mobilizing transposase RayT